jgi:hypothetical protein
MKWWEKTVEYIFVLSAVRDHKMFVAPLDGIEELAGDAIFCSKNKWILIEFKKDKASISDEKLKFEVLYFDKAKIALKDKDAHHFIVYGKAGLLAQSHQHSHIELCFQTYFSKTIKVTIGDMLQCGADLISFIDYVTTVRLITE